MWNILRSVSLPRSYHPNSSLFLPKMNTILHFPCPPFETHTHITKRIEIEFDHTRQQTLVLVLELTTFPQNTEYISSKNFSHRSEVSFSSHKNKNKWISPVLGHPGVGVWWVRAHQVVDGLTVIVMESRTSPAASTSQSVNTSRGYFLFFELKMILTSRTRIYSVHLLWFHIILALWREVHRSISSQNFKQ